MKIPIDIHFKLGTATHTVTVHNTATIKGLICPYCEDLALYIHIMNMIQLLLSGGQYPSFKAGGAVNQGSTVRLMI